MEIRSYPYPICDDRSRIADFIEWSSNSFRKVALKADDKEFEKLKKEFTCFVVVDAGYTQVAPGSETCMALWPMRKSQVTKTLKRLQVL